MDKIKEDMLELDINNRNERIQDRVVDEYCNSHKGFRRPVKRNKKKKNNDFNALKDHQICNYTCTKKIQIYLQILQYLKTYIFSSNILFTIINNTIIYLIYANLYIYTLM